MHHGAILDVKMNVYLVVYSPIITTADSCERNTQKRKRHKKSKVYYDLEAEDFPEL